jgi:hypothetical protein
LAQLSVILRVNAPISPGCGSQLIYATAAEAVKMDAEIKKRSSKKKTKNGHEVDNPIDIDGLSGIEKTSVKKYACRRRHP